MAHSAYVFLDFDGVLHRVGGEVFQPECLDYLADALDPLPGVCLVISSSWREVYDLEALQDFLGPRLGPRIVGTNPVIDDPFLHQCRYHECMAFLADSGAPDAPWVALDDEPGNYPAGAPVIYTNYRTALTREDADALRSLLSARILLPNAPETDNLAR